MISNYLFFGALLISLLFQFFAEGGVIDNFYRSLTRRVQRLLVAMLVVFTCELLFRFGRGNLVDAYVGFMDQVMLTHLFFVGGVVLYDKVRGDSNEGLQVTGRIITLFTLLTTVVTIFSAIYALGVASRPET